MTEANGLRLLLAARKSRKGDGEPYERQDYRAKTWAEREGHAVIGFTADTVSSQTAPLQRKSLGPWMTDLTKLAMYDGILVSDTDRISRGTQQDFVDIEHWCNENGKRIVVARGPQYPARTDSERGDWDAEKRRARTYWEDVRDKHADTQEVIRANGGAIGKPPFGYVTDGPKLHKRFVINPVTGPLAVEAFQRIADGRTATSVAIWLTEVTGQTWRVKRVTDMIQRLTYLGERDGHTFEALVSVELWDNANAALASRSCKHKDTGGRRTVHGYSGLIYCLCGAQLYRHKSEGGPEKYRCARGRRGFSESRCEHEGIPFKDANTAVDALMLDDHTPEWVMVTTGGDHGRQMELQRIQEAMSSAMTRKDMATVTRLAAEFAAVDGKPAEPVKTMPRKTGRTHGEVWRAGNLADRRAMLDGWQGVYFVTVILKDAEVRARIDEADDTP